VLQTACRTAATWQREFARQPALTISVNISARQLVDDQLPADVGAALASSGLDPGALILEVAESALIDGGRDISRRLGQLHDLGVRLAVDDFGTGYSSFGHLRRFPVDILKVDRSLVGSMNGGDELSDVLRSLLALGRSLGLELVAEGIELDSQLVTLRHQGALAGQGFLFARPLSELDAEALLIDPAGVWEQQRSER
jgi:EAL domain-containing protein (putative c-di-GMP-specific phosphodiesterase class I)